MGPYLVCSELTGILVIFLGRVVQAEWSGSEGVFSVYGGRDLPGQETTDSLEYSDRGQGPPLILGVILVHPT